MKKLLLIACVALFGFSANAQVRLGFGLGYAVPSGDIADFTDGGLSGHFELGYAITDDIDVSFLYQGDFLIGADVEGGSIGNVTLGSYMLNGRYYFKEEGFRPYGSLGFGLTSIGTLEFESDDDSLVVDGGASESSFAFRPALGFKYKLLNFNVAYLSAGKVNEASVADITVNIGLMFTIGGKK